MMESPYIQYLPDGTSFPMFWVEGGTFSMGEDQKPGSLKLLVGSPSHQVQLDSFFIGKFPVTQQVWQTVMGINPSYFKGDNRPVECVSWSEICDVFLPKLNELTSASRPSGFSFRLPTEAEWEYAAIGGGMAADFRFAGSDNPRDVGWYSKNSHDETKDVGLKMPNPIGLFDMCGNVWEWCHDWYLEPYFQQCQEVGVVHNPKGPDFGLERINKGGAWSQPSYSCGIKNPHHNSPNNRLRDIGFRLVLSNLAIV